MVKRRELGREAILARAREAKDLGFGAYGVTGGEPFILDYMPELIAELGRGLPTAARHAGRPPDVSYSAGVDQRTRIRLTKYSTKAG